MTAVRILGAGHPLAQTLRRWLAAGGRRVLADCGAAGSDGLPGGLGGAVDCLIDGRALAEAGRGVDWDELDRLARAYAAERGPELPGSLIALLPAGMPAARWHDRQAAAVRLRALALDVAPALRVNAIGPGDDPQAVCNALDLILAAPTMTGQILWLDGAPRHHAVGTAAIARLRAADGAVPPCAEAGAAVECRSPNPQ